MFMFYAQIMPCGTYLDAQKIIDKEACYETSVSLHFTLWTSWRQGLRDRGCIE